jgi:hypothetical protein
MGINTFYKSNYKTLFINLCFTIKNIDPPPLQAIFCPDLPGIRSHPHLSKWGISAKLKHDF